MEKISKAQLVELLRNVKGATPVTVTLNTEPSNLIGGKSCPFAGCRKIQRTNIVLNFNYEKSVNRQRGREDKEQDFKAEKGWGEHVDNSLLIEKDGNFYLQGKIEKVLQVAYFHNGQEVEIEKIKPFLRERKPSEKQDLNKTVAMFKPKIENVKELVMNKELYVIEG